MIEQCLARCETVQSQLNPFTAIYHDDAMAAAKLVKDRQANGLPMRPMEGIPIAIKEFTPIKGKAHHPWINGIRASYRRRSTCSGATPA
jgi:Asp-tRNA(Asn)/Glu-tRNA(Gln) amidotransferase A subunit family amidase